MKWWFESIYSLLKTYSYEEKKEEGEPNKYIKSADESGEIKRVIINNKGF
jgi:hypothetical protein